MNTRTSPRLAEAETIGLHLEPKTAALIPARDHPTTLHEVIAACKQAGIKAIVIDEDNKGVIPAMPTGPDVVRCAPPHPGTRTAALRIGAALAREHGFTAAITLAAGYNGHLESDLRPLLHAARQHWPAVVVGEAPLNKTTTTGAGRLGKMIGNFCLRLESGRNLPGGLSTCRLYPLNLLSGDFLSQGNAFETEILVRASWSGLPVIAVPAVHSTAAHGGGILNRLRLCALHAWLITLSLMPWRPRPQTSAGEKKTPTVSPLLHPVRFFRQLCVEHSSPFELAAAAWVGIFIGALPIIPFGIAAIVYVCHRFHLNKLAGAGASNVCVAPFVPFLCVQAGHFMQHGTWWTTFTRHALVNEIHLRLWEWLLGALIVGPILATLGGFITYVMIVRWRENQR